MGISGRANRAGGLGPGIYKGEGMFRVLLRVMRHFVAMPMLVAVAVLATVCAPGVWIAGCRVRQGHRNYCTDAPAAHGAKGTST